MSSHLLRIAGAFMVGILLGSAFLYFPWTIIILCLAALATATWLVRRGALSPGAVLLSAVTVLIGASALVTARTRLPADHYIRSTPLDGAYHDISGRIASPLERDPDRTVFLFDVERIDGRPATGTLRASIRDPAVRAGYLDRVSVRGRLFPPRGAHNPGGFDYPAHLARQGVLGIVSIRRNDGVVVRRRGNGPARLVQDLRERIRQAFLRSTSGDGSAVLQAMVLGEKGGLTDSLRERFMAAGVTHILSISGSHLGLVAVLCFWTCRQLLFLLPERRYHWLTLRLDPKKVAAGVTVLPVTFYAFLAGAEVATMRALIMILAGLAAVLLDRESDLLPALAAAALITLVPSPQALYDISFQLSYLSVVAIAFTVRTWNVLLPPPAGIVRRWRHRAALLLLISVTATVATGPLVAFYFRQISFAGIVANMVAVPFAGAFVVPLGLVSGVLSLCTGGLPFAGLDQAAADAFVAIVSFFAHFPIAAVHVPAPGPIALIAYAGLIASAALWARARLLSRSRPLETSARVPRAVVVAAAVSLGVLVLAVLVPRAFHRSGRITFIDVGQGDSAMVRSARGRTIVIDGGGTRDGRFDVGGRIVAPYLWDRGVGRIDLLVASHPHPDHVNGLISLLRLFPVGEIWWSGRDRGLEGAVALQRVAAERHVPLRTVSAGDGGVIDDITLDVLHPDVQERSRERAAYAAENDRSLVLRLRMGDRTVLFTGDLHRSGEASLLRGTGDVRAEVLKVPHHGSKTSSSEAFIRAVHPAAAVISAGAGNPYHHPSPEVLDRYRDAGTEVFRTDRDGAVLMEPRRNGWTTLRWTDLVLRTIGVTDPAGWGAGERANWERLWIRTRGI